MKNYFKSIIVILLLTSIMIIPFNNSKAALGGVFVNPPAAILGLTLVLGISSTPVISDIYSPSNPSRSFDRVTNASIFGTLFTGSIGLLILKNEKDIQFYEFSEIDSKLSQALDISKKDQIHFNSVIEEVNTLIQQITFDLMKSKSLQSKSMNELSSIYKGHLSSDTKKVFQKILKKILTLKK